MSLGARAVRPCAIAALVAACAGAPDAAHQLTGRAEATSRVDRNDVAFGDDVTLTVEVRSDPALDVELPQPSAFDGFRTVDQRTLRDDGSHPRVERRWYRLRAERAGSLTLPALSVRYRAASRAAGARAREAEGAADDASALPLDGGESTGDRGEEHDREPEVWTTIATAPIAVEVRSLLPPDVAEPPAIRDIKPLQRIERPRPWLWLAVAVALVTVLAGALALFVRRRRAAPAEPAPAIPAHQIALAALERLAALDLRDDEALRRFYFALSEIVRGYVEGRFGLNATDLTTEEIVASLDRLPLPAAGADALGAFLGDADRVKFAAYRPRREDAASMLERARRFVEDTRPVAAPLHVENGAREAA